MNDVPAFIDEHAVTIQADRQRVWAAVRRYADGLGLPARGPLGAAARLLWAAEPASGFAVAGARPGEELVLEGRHRFSRYRLVFALVDAPGGATTLTASSYGDFPGAHGRAYRALVVGTRAHVLAVRRMLEHVRSRALTG